MVRERMEHAGRPGEQHCWRTEAASEWRKRHSAEQEHKWRRVEADDGCACPGTRWARQREKRREQ